MAKEKRVEGLAERWVREARAAVERALGSLRTDQNAETVEKCRTYFAAAEVTPPTAFPSTGARRNIEKPRQKLVEVLSPSHKVLKAKTSEALGFSDVINSEEVDRIILHSAVHSHERAVRLLLFGIAFGVSFEIKPDGGKALNREAFKDVCTDLHLGYKSFSDYTYECSDVAAMRSIEAAVGEFASVPFPYVSTDLVVKRVKGRDTNLPSWINAETKLIIKAKSTLGNDTICHSATLRKALMGQGITIPDEMWSVALISAGFRTVPEKVVAEKVASEVDRIIADSAEPDQPGANA